MNEPFLAKKTISTVRTAGEIQYTLVHKKVKNINLRIRSDGSITVSAHRLVPMTAIDRFVLSKTEWILNTQRKLAQQQAALSGDSHNQLSNEECYCYLSQICAQIYPLFEEFLSCIPALKVRDMKSCWGVCHPNKNYITLNKKLIDKPVRAIEYVIAHEYAHFIYPHHQKEFYALLERIMPDHRFRKELLK